MADDAPYNALYKALTQLEFTLAQIGDGLQFMVKVDGGLEIVRRDDDGLPTRPKEVVTELAGADPLLWQSERPEGDIALGQPYQEPTPRCALSGQFLPRSGPVELYYRGQPVDAAAAITLSPRLTLLHSLTTSLNDLLAELWRRIARGDASTETEVLVKDVVARIHQLFRILDSEAGPETPDRETPDRETPNPTEAT